MRATEISDGLLGLFYIPLEGIDLCLEREAILIFIGQASISSSGCRPLACPACPVSLSMYCHLDGTSILLP